MERKIGEIFTYNGKTYQVVESNTCMDCAFNGMICGLLMSSIGNCNNFIADRRTDRTNIVFKKINNMEIKNNQLTIDIPEGMEIDLENSDLAKGIIKLKPKNLTYEDILQTYTVEYGNLVISSRHINKLLAVSKLMDIAKYYNGNWKPNWRSLTESKYYIYYSTQSNIYGVSNTSSTKYINIYFRLYKDAKAVIDNPNFRDILDAIYKN